MFDVKEYKRSFYLKNKEKYLKKAKDDYYARNKPIISARRKIQRQNETVEQKQKRAEYMLKYREGYKHIAAAKASTVEYRYEHYYKKNAPKRGFVFELTLEDFRKMFEAPCVYCGDLAHGVDRVDNSIGYTKENSVACCGMCNKMKWVLSKKDFLNQVIKIAKHHG